MSEQHWSTTIAADVVNKFTMAVGDHVRMEDTWA